MILEFCKITYQISKESGSMVVMNQIEDLKIEFRNLNKLGKKPNQGKYVVRMYA